VPVSLVQFAVALTVASLALYGLMMWLFAQTLRRRRVTKPIDIPRAPRVTILKPLAGIDDELEANLASFARIDYPSFEILFGVASASDPAYAVASSFLAQHPEIDARVVVTDPEEATNPKVAQLACLERVASGDVFVISDSNVRVQAQYLWSLVNELADERVGMVWSLFAGSGETTLGAALENLHLCASTVPGLLAMNAVISRPLTVGKSMAVRRRALACVGGFLSVGEVLAEDHVLGRRFLDHGCEVRTVLEPVENRNVSCSIMRTIERHTRWSKIRRALSPAGFVTEPIMTPVLAASMGLALAPCKITWAMLCLACVGQTAIALTAVRLLRGHWMSWRYLPLEVVRSYIALVCWLRAWASRRIEWRGHAFVLKPGSAIVPVAAAAERTASLARLAA
jgi:ceramide glucosyltransferase